MAHLAELNFKRPEPLVGVQMGVEGARHCAEIARDYFASLGMRKI